MTDAGFLGTTVEQVAAEVASRAVSAREQVERALRQIDRLDGTLHAFVVVDAERAITDAERIDQRIAAGEAVGPLAGVPLAVKDVEHVAGLRTTYGSALHADDAPATEDSEHVARLRAAGCVVIGKTNTPEFGWQADTSNQVFPATGNAWDPTRSAGGSSGGSAAAVAAGMVPLATGSDGGGSIRIPSAVHGLSGMKASLGRVPIGGPRPPQWMHLSCKGPMARRIRDVALALDAVIGFDPTDVHSLPPHHGASWRESLEDLLPPRRVLWSADLGYGTVDAEVAAVCRAAVDRLADQGTEVIEVDAVFDEDPAFVWASVAYGAILRTLERHRDTDAWERITPGLRTMLGLVEGQRATDVLRAIDAGHLLNHRLVELLHGGAVLLCPTVAGQTGPVGGQGTIDGEPSTSWVSFTYPFNVTGSPAGTVCAGHTADGMPVGLQVVGPRLGDVVVLRVLAHLEDLLGVDTVAPLDWAG
ncbi:MAG TPA: amidase family protein [Acidimicrobiales bacterium]|nr:amidase family protein [Acidimicrobiales bacterium]